MKKIAAITVVYKFPQERINTLIKQLTKQGISQKDIYIKDNTNENVGYAGGINRVLRKVINKYDYFLILNPDVDLNKKFLKELLRVANQGNAIGVVGPRMVNNQKKTYIDGGSIDKVRYSSILEEKHMKTKQKNEPVKDVEYVSGSAMLIKKEVFEKIGLFREDYFLYYEETDFCFRAKRAKFKMVISPRAIIYHRESETVGKGSPAMDYYMARNHLLFLERFAPFLVKVHEFVRLPKTIWETRERKYELLGIRDYFFRHFGRNLEIKNTVDL